MVWLEGAGVWAKLAPRKYPSDTDPPKLAAPPGGASSPASSPTATAANDADADDAPPSCAICLDDLIRQDKAVLTPCMHEFHHACVAKWLFSFAARLACPLCKAPPASLLHSILSDGSYVEKELVPPAAVAADPGRADVMARLAAILEVSLARRGPRGGGGVRRRATREPRGHDGPSPYAERVARHARAAAAAAGPAFGFRGDREPTTLGGEEDGDSEDAEATALRRRRRVYTDGRWAVPLGAAAAPPRPLVAPASGSARQRRVGEWVHRELQALLGAEEDVALVQAFVVGLVTTYGAAPPEPPARLSHPGVALALAAAGGGAARADDPVAHLTPFLGARAPHFWHELCCFVTAPAYTIETYDQICRYERPGWEDRRGRGGGGGGRERRSRSGSGDEGERRQRRSRSPRERGRRGERSRSRSRSPRRRRAEERRRSPAERDSGNDRWRMWAWGDPIE